jgi:hypothetical protein
MTTTTVFLASFSVSMVAGAIILAQAPEAHADYAKCRYTTAVSKVCPQGGNDSGVTMKESTYFQPAPLNNKAPTQPGKYTYHITHDSHGWHVTRTPRATGGTM